MNVKRITAVLLVEDVEPCVEFWVNRLGFAKTGEVPGEGKLAFAMLQKGDTQLMYQSFASVQKDDPHAAAVARRGPTFLFVEVDNLEETKAATQGSEVVMAERKTFYGSREIGIKEPGGHYVTFAQFG